MINDLPSVVEEAQCLLFADDLKLFLSIANVSDCGRLQRDIDRVVQWSVCNKLHFNVTKCEVMSYTRARAPLNWQYTMDSRVIPRVTSVHDLGILMVPELTFRNHINDVCGKSFRNLGFILRQCKSFRAISVIKILFNALVRSRLETSSIIWNPHEAKYSLMLEKLQNKFARFLYHKQYGVYPYYPLMYPSLFVLGMVGYCRLDVRRNVALVKYVYAVWRGWVHHPELLCELQLCVPRERVATRRATPMFRVPTARTNMLKFSPLSRAIRLLNLISEHVDICHCSLPKFAVVAQKCIEVEGFKM